NDATAVYPVGSTVITWLLTDVHGNTAACQMTINVVDPEWPVITCPADISVNSDAGQCNAVVTVPSAIVSDNCAVASVTNDYTGTSDASATYPVGTTVITWTVTDIYGNAASCTQTVVVTDIEEPQIICPPNLTSNTDPGVCEAFVAIATPAVSDNCGIASVVNDYTGTGDASAIYPTGETIVTFTVTDIHGNQTSCTVTVTVNDLEAPVVNCTDDISVTTDAGVCEAFVPVAAPVVSDNCGIASVTNDFTGIDNADGIYPQGTTVVTWTITDIHGNVSNCTTTVTVSDIELPSLTCPENLSVNTDPGVCEAFVTVNAPIIGDNCGVALLVNDYTGTDNASAVYPEGTTVVEWTLTDVHGNVSTCTQTIVVTDNELPTVTCPTDVLVNNDPAVCGANIIIPSAIVNDNCGIASVVNDYNDTDDASDLYPVGTTTVTWTITDIHGNSTSCSMIVVVVDNELPSIVCPADVNTTTDNGLCEAFVAISAPVVNDNCQVMSVTNDYTGTDNASANYPEGTTVITWTVTDIYGNIQSCTQTVIVSDDEAPAIDCPENITINSDGSGCSAEVLIPVATGTDNCGVATIINDYTGTNDASGIYPVGNNFVTWTITDIHGNTSTCTMSVTVIDTEVPVIACPASIEVPMDPGTCTALVMVPEPVVSDNCSVQNVTNDFNGTDDASGVYPAGTTTVVWTVTDVFGNTSTCEMT
ncbi:MAG: HYR domain-containing protein, partial [Flavobacteriales bacterium]|nr:HYR domain-containing protein [Flavobacteriales bacterium]